MRRAGTFIDADCVNSAQIIRQVSASNRELTNRKMRHVYALARVRTIDAWSTNALSLISRLTAEANRPG